MKYLFISILWIGYCALHSYLISTRFTDTMSRFLKNYSAFYRLFYVLISLALLIPLIKYTSQSASSIIISYPFPWSVVQYTFTYGSLLMFFWAFFFNYNPLAFFGILQILNFRKNAKENSPPEIKRNGLLGIIRHPMYLALIIFLWSQTFNEIDILVNTILTVYVIIGTKLEENKLVLEFGQAYVNYQQEVPMLIPFLKRTV